MEDQYHSVMVETPIFHKWGILNGAAKDLMHQQRPVGHQVFPGRYFTVPPFKSRYMNVLQVWTKQIDPHTRAVILI